MAVDRQTREGTSRDQLIHLLRQGPSTADELAAALGLTPGGVRQHLAVLERDGILVRGGLRRTGGVGKPAMVYEIAPDAERAYSSAYAPVLTALLAVLPTYMRADRLESLLADVGTKLATAIPPAQGDVNERAATAAAILEGLGGVTSVSTEPDGSIVVAGCACPLNDAVTVEPKVCQAVERMLATVTHLDVREHCDRSDKARCRFVLTAPSSRGGG
jgi:predicted ArsR family transcriptional regulator